MQPKSDTEEHSSSNAKFSSHFLKGKLLSLSTSYSVQMKPQTPQTIPEIITYPCEVLKDQLRKCFKITFQDSSIFVEDRIDFGPTFRHAWNQRCAQISNLSIPLHQNWANSDKKVVRFKHGFLRKGALQGKTDQKNIVKNVIKAFLKYLKEQNSANQTSKGVQQIVQNLGQTLKFNNQLIVAITKQPRARACFKHFLATNALEWIQHSKIKNKGHYGKIIQKYQKMCAVEEEARPDQVQISSKGSQSVGHSLNLRDLENYDLEDVIRGFQ